jgi:hypothetical protein
MLILPQAHGIFEKGGVNNPGKYLAGYKTFGTLFKSFCKKENVTCLDN